MHPYLLYKWTFVLVMFFTWSRSAARACLGRTDIISFRSRPDLSSLPIASCETLPDRQCHPAQRLSNSTRQHRGCSSLTTRITSFIAGSTENSPPRRYRPSAHDFGRSDLRPPTPCRHRSGPILEFRTAEITHHDD